MNKILHTTLALFRMNVVIFLLLVLTAAAFLLQSYVLDTHYYVDLSKYASSSTDYVVITSDSVGGGNSIVELVITDSSVIVNYELGNANAYPYAGLQIYFGDGKIRGRNFAKYDSLFIWIKPYDEGSMRIYLRNYDPSLYREGDLTSLKFNEIEFFPSKEIRYVSRIEQAKHGVIPAVFVPEEFRLPSWWVAQNAIDVHRARVDFSNVPLIEVQTGTNAPLGKGSFEIIGIGFKGKVISKLTLTTVLVSIWFVTFLIILILRFMQYRRTQRLNRERQKDLEDNLKALEVERNNYERKSKTDPLTGCRNRAGFADALTREQRRLQRLGIPVSFVIMDIDHFKDVNDTYGHNTGDEVLLNLSKLVKGQIRNSDTLVRWGGEEFVVLCDDTPLQNAERLAEKLRLAIESAEIIKQRRITCSFGVAEMVPGEPPQNLFERTDKALYVSKETGRNKVTVSKFDGN